MVGIGELREKRLVIDMRHGVGVGVKSCALRNPTWRVCHRTDREWVPEREEIAAKSRGLEFPLDIRSATDVQRVHIRVDGWTALGDCLTRGRLRHDMRSQIAPTHKAELPRDRELGIGELEGRSMRTAWV